MLCKTRVLELHEEPSTIGMKRRTSLAAWAFALATVCAAGSVFGDPVDLPTLAFVPVATNMFSAPTGITHAGDGSQRLFVLEQGGRIWIIQHSGVLAQPFLNITNRVLTAGAEQGLLGLAFPPGYSTKAHFYVDYTRQSDGAVVISRFSLTADSNVADANSEQVVMVIPKPYNNHNGGQLAFGPDGYLYIGVGDGGSEGDPLKYGQNTHLLLGKLLRIDVESGVSPYAIPASNPFVGKTNYAPEIWAFGLRNPWRFSFDRLTGDLYIGDVGQDLYEEIDFQAAGSSGGQNYGWSIMEGASNYVVPAGFTNFSALTLPVMTYNHLALPADGGGAVTGGYVYRGPSMPRLDGVYFFGDFVNGWLWALKPVGTNWQSFVLLNPSDPSPPYAFAISTFGEDDQGLLYLADYNSGKIYQIQDTGLVWTPTFSAAAGVINSNTVVVTCVTTNAAIHFTTNGIDPAISDPAVASGGSIPVNSGITNKIRAFRSDLTPSVVVSAVYTLQTGTPGFTPAAGFITNNTVVSLGDVTPGTAIYFTTNGTTPTTNSPLYTGPLTLSGPVTVEALGVAGGYSNSLIGVASYYAAQVAEPAFTPYYGPITNGTLISISCATPGALIYYTLDGSAPSHYSFFYSGPFAINGGVTVSAFAMESGYVSSLIQRVFYALAPAATPVLTPGSGPVAYGTTVSISCLTPGAVIYYTLDDSLPNTSSARYSNPVKITNDVTLNAYAVASGYPDSLVTSVHYTLTQAATPSFSPSQGPLTNGSLISMSCATPNAIINYTLDGTVPGSNSPVFTHPLVFTGPVTLQARARAPQFDPGGVQSAFFSLLDPENAVVTTLSGSTNAGFSNGIATLARFSSPEGICVDPAGNLYVADTGNNVIRKILPTGQVTTFAGTGVDGDSLGPATNAQFSGPTGVCLDNAGNLYVADGGNCNRICQVDTNGMVTIFTYITLCGPGIGSFVPGLWQMVTGPDGNIYVGYWSGLIEMFPGGSWLGIAGNSSWGMYVGPGVDRATNVYSAAGNSLWQTAPNATYYSTVLFAGGTGAFSDGPRLLAGFTDLQDAVVDSFTNIFLSDTTRVRKIRLDGWVSTLAGTGVPGYRDGPGSVAQFNDATGMCMDRNGNIYVADAGNNMIRKITPLPTLSLALTNRQVVLSWPNWAGSFILESSGSLSPNAVWTPLTNGVMTSMNNFVLTNTIGVSASFYRLHAQ